MTIEQVETAVEATQADEVLSLQTRVKKLEKIVANLLWRLRESGLQNVYAVEDALGELDQPVRRTRLPKRLRS